MLAKSSSGCMFTVKILINHFQVVFLFSFKRRNIWLIVSTEQTSSSLWPPKSAVSHFTDSLYLLLHRNGEETFGRESFKAESRKSVVGSWKAALHVGLWSQTIATENKWAPSAKGYTKWRCKEHWQKESWVKSCFQCPNIFPVIAVLWNICEWKWQQSFLSLSLEL